MRFFYFQQLDGHVSFKFLLLSILWFFLSLDAQADAGGLQHGAQTDNAQVQFEQGLRYLRGDGVLQDEKKAFSWLSLAAEQGHSDAMFTLGEMYYYGQGVIADSAQAYEWHLRAAQMDPVELLLPDWSSEPAECEGYGWNRAVAQERHLANKGGESLHYYEGLLYEMDSGDAQAQFCYGTMLLAMQGDEALELSARRRAFAWLRKAALQGHSRAQNDLAALYRTGWGGIGLNPEKALSWYLRSAKQGDAGGQFGAGMMNLGWFGLAENLNEAVYWLELAAEQKHVGALYQLGQMYEEGMGVAPDALRALELYRQAVEDSVYYPRLLAGAQAAYRAGLMYYYGLGVEQDDAEAFMMFEEAWGINYRYRVPEAAVYIGVMYLQGRGVSQDTQTGVLFLQEGAFGEEPAAICMMEAIAPDVREFILMRSLEGGHSAEPALSSIALEYSDVGEAVLAAQVNVTGLLQACPLPRAVPDDWCCF